MIIQFLKSQKQAWLQFAVAFAVWVFIITALLTYYQIYWGYSFFYALVFSIFTISGFFLLEHIFKYFLPSGKNTWLIFLFPMFIAIAFTMLLEIVVQAVEWNDLQNELFIKKTFFVRLLVAWILFTAYSLILNFYGRLEDEMESKARIAQNEQLAKEAELYHIRQQLQPHFLFNSLNSISSLGLSNPEKARQMIIMLSEFLRFTIQKDDKSTVSIKDEIDYLQRYLEIEKLRFGHRLAVVIDLSKDCEQLHLPALLLQPLVENAVKFGLYGTLEQVLIHISVKCDHDYLIIEISNPVEEIGLATKGSGYGLKAIRRRLYLLYGRNDLLSTHEKEKLFVATLKIPVKND